MLENIFNKIKEDWKSFFEQEFKKEYFNQLLKNIYIEYKNNICFPKKENIFRLFTLIKPKDIKVVILGQDPYHGKNQANGLAFSVNNDIPLPPSLINIFKELFNDLNIKRTNGDLTSWVKQGVFLYNCISTVKKGIPCSHENLGWKIFTKSLILFLNKINNGIIYILWGKKSQIYSEIIKSKYVIVSAHPSPFSYSKFSNSKPFSKANNFLKLENKKEIIW